MTASFNGLAFNTLPFNGPGTAPSAVVAMLPTATFRAIEIVPPSPASPWSIDPDRTQAMTPSSAGWQSSPWSIDPDRTQEIAP